MWTSQSHFCSGNRVITYEIRLTFKFTYNFHCPQLVPLDALGHLTNALRVTCACDPYILPSHVPHTTHTPLKFYKHTRHQPGCPVQPRSACRKLRTHKPSGIVQTMSASNNTGLEHSVARSSDISDQEAKAIELVIPEIIFSTFDDTVSDSCASPSPGLSMGPTFGGCITCQDNDYHGTGSLYMLAVEERDLDRIARVFDDVNSTADVDTPTITYASVDDETTIGGESLVGDRTIVSCQSIVGDESEVSRPIDPCREEWAFRQAFTARSDLAVPSVVHYEITENSEMTIKKSESPSVEYSLTLRPGYEVESRREDDGNQEAVFLDDVSNLTPSQVIEASDPERQEFNEERSVVDPMDQIVFYQELDDHMQIETAASERLHDDDVADGASGQDGLTVRAHDECRQPSSGLQTAVKPEDDVKKTPDTVGEHGEERAASDRIARRKSVGKWIEGLEDEYIPDDTLAGSVIEQKPELEPQTEKVERDVSEGHVERGAGAVRSHAILAKDIEQLPAPKDNPSTSSKSGFSKIRRSRPTKVETSFSGSGSTVIRRTRGISVESSFSTGPFSLYIGACVGYPSSPSKQDRGISKPPGDTRQPSSGHEKEVAEPKPSASPAPLSGDRFGAPPPDTPRGIVVKEEYCSMASSLEALTSKTMIQPVNPQVKGAGGTVVPQARTNRVSAPKDLANDGKDGILDEPLTDVVLITALVIMGLLVLFVGTAKGAN